MIAHNQGVGGLFVKATQRRSTRSAKSFLSHKVSVPSIIIIIIVLLLSAEVLRQRSYSLARTQVSPRLVPSSLFWAPGKARTDTLKHAGDAEAYSEQPRE